MKLTYCRLVGDDGAIQVMLLRAHLEPMDALYYCARMGMQTKAGDFSCWPVPDELVELFREHTERVLTAAKAQELFGDKWEGALTS